MVILRESNNQALVVSHGVEKERMILKIVSAIGGDVIEIDVPPQSTVSAVKREIALKKKIPHSTVLLVYRGKQLDDDMMLEDASIGDYDKLYLITRTEGGNK
jgi:hypothetical protein